MSTNTSTNKTTSLDLRLEAIRVGIRKDVQTYWETWNNPMRYSVLVRKHSSAIRRLDLPDDVRTVIETTNGLQMLLSRKGVRVLLPDGIVRMLNSKAELEMKLAEVDEQK